MTPELLWKAISVSPEDTTSIIKTRVLPIVFPYVIYIDGQMGSGKTFISRCIGKYYNNNDIVSNSFSKISLHDGLPKFIHCDFYNIEKQDEFFFSNIYDLIDDSSVILLEWSKCFFQIEVPQFFLKIELTTKLNRRLMLYKLGQFNISI